MEYKNKKKLNAPRTKLEIFLASIVIIVIIVGIILLITFFLQRPDKIDEESKDLKCHTAECVEIASGILDKLDTGIDPCEDFYEFACGRAKPSTAEKYDEAKSLKDLVDKANAQQSRPKYLEIVKDFYESCMNEELIESLGGKPMLDLINRLGGDPLILGEDWHSDLDPEGIYLRARKAGVRKFEGFAIGSVIDELNPPKVVPTLNTNKFIWIRYDKLKSLTMLLGGPEHIFDNEVEAAKVYLRIYYDYRTPNNTYERQTIKELQAKYSYLSWVEFINALLPENRALDENTVIVVRDARYFERLEEAFKDKRLMATRENFAIKWIYGRYLSRDFRKVLDPLQDRAQECLNLTKTHMPIELAASYAHLYAPHRTQYIASRMFSDLREVYVYILTNSTLPVAKNKPPSFKVLSRNSIIGYHWKIQNDNALKKYLQKRNITKDAFFNNMFFLEEWTKKWALERILFPKATEDIFERSNDYLQSQCFHNSDSDTFIYPVTLFQNKIFNEDWPMYINFAVLGWSMAKCLALQLDSYASNRDHFRNQYDWLTSSSVFKSETLHCDDYENEDQLEANDTQIANTTTRIRFKDAGREKSDNLTKYYISEVEGIRMAFEAYKSYSRKYDEGTNLPGLNYTNSQLFWIAAAQSHCSPGMQPIMDDDLSRKAIVNGAVLNSNSFSETFKCSNESTMSLNRKLVAF